MLLVFNIPKLGPKRINSLFRDFKKIPHFGFQNTTQMQKGAQKFDRNSPPDVGTCTYIIL